MQLIRTWAFPTLCLLAWLAMPAAWAQRGNNPVSTGAVTANQSVATVTGTVYDPSGKPAPGVEITTWPRFGFSATDYRTDSRGRFSLTWQPTANMLQQTNLTVGLLALDRSGGLAAAEAIDGLTSNQDLHLTPALTLSGSAKGGDGKPLVGAEVHLLMSVGFFGEEFERGQKTDEHGGFVYHNLPQGMALSVTVRPEGYIPSGRRVLGMDTQTTNLVLEPFLFQTVNTVARGGGANALRPQVVQFGGAGSGPVIRGALVGPAGTPLRGPTVKPAVGSPEWFQSWPSAHRRFLWSLGVAQALVLLGAATAVFLITRPMRSKAETP